MDERLSLGVSVVLLLLYAANLIYTLVTHRDVFAGDAPGGEAEWGLARALTVTRGHRGVGMTQSVRDGALPARALPEHAAAPCAQFFSAESGTASAAAWKPILEWVPSQNGFFVDAPQRQSTVLS